MKLDNIIVSFKHNFTKLFIRIIIITVILFIINIIIIYNNGLNMEYKNNSQLISDSFYFTITTITSTGYGDILPNKQWSKVLIALEQFGIFFMVISLMEIYQREDIVEDMKEESNIMMKNKLSAMLQNDGIIERIKLNPNVTKKEVVDNVMKATDIFKKVKIAPLNA